MKPGAVQKSAFQTQDINHNSILTHSSEHTPSIYLKTS